MHCIITIIIIITKLTTPLSTNLLGNIHPPQRVREIRLRQGYRMHPIRKVMRRVLGICVLHRTSVVVYAPLHGMSVVVLLCAPLLPSGSRNKLETPWCNVRRVLLHQEVRDESSDRNSVS
jgi:ABC-type xylose transport system permease subunit